MSEQARLAWRDHEREEGTLTEVTKGRDGWYSVTSSNGWSCGVSAEHGVEPKVGDAFVTWGSIGSPIRGQAINGHVLYYRTPAQQDREDAMRADEAKAERIAEYEGARSQWDARVAALPEPLRARVEGFRAFRGDAWRWEFEPYEVMCCEEAAGIAAQFTTGDAISAFAKLGYEEQKAAYARMDAGHSGNSWGKALRFAWLLVERPDLLPMEHGALCPLTGCEAYGCFAVRAPAPAEESGRE